MSPSSIRTVAAVRSHRGTECRRLIRVDQQGHERCGTLLVDGADLDSSAFRGGVHRREGNELTSDCHQGTGRLMHIRIGRPGHERPGILTADGTRLDTSTALADLGHADEEEASTSQTTGTHHRGNTP